MGGTYDDKSYLNQAFVDDYRTQPPTVSKLSPADGPTAGGTIVTISGTNLFTPSAVRFGTTTAKIDAVVSATEIEVTSPKGAGTVDVTIIAAGGTSAKATSDHFAYVPAPTVTSLSPTMGPSIGGTPVTIIGANLRGATGVHFGSAVAKIDSIVSATEIKVTSPKGAGVVGVTVTTAGGTSANLPADHFTY